MLRDFLLSIPYLAQFGYMIVAVAAFLEAVPIVGLFTPGQTIVAIGGFFAHQKILDVRLVFLVAFVGTVLGDTVGYFFGRKYGTRFFMKQKGFVKDTMRLVQAHPVKTLILGRFNALTHTFAPLAAGASGVRMRTFFIANICGGLLSTAAWVGLGFIFGASYEFASAAASRILFIAVILLVILFIGYRYLRKQGKAHRRITVLLAASTLSVIVFCFLVYQLRHPGILWSIDQAINTWLPTIHTPVAIAIAKAFSALIHPISIALLTGCMIGLLWLRRNKRAIVLFLTVVIGAFAIENILKVLILRARPIGGLVDVSTASFPSGHAFMAFAIAGAIWLCYDKYMHERTLFGVLCLAMPVVIVIARFYLGVHWFTDIIAGIAGGIFWLCFVFLIDEAHRTYKNNQKEQLYRN